MPDVQTPAGAMSAAVKIPTKGDQGMMDVSAGLQRTARLGMTETQGLSTDTTVGMTTTTTAPTRAVSGATGITRWRVLALWKTGWARASSHRAMRATISTASTTRKSWTSKVLQVRHVSDLGS